MEKKEIFKQEFKSYETYLHQDHLVFENYGGYDKSKIRKGIFELSGESHHDEESFLENYSNLMCAVTQRSKMIVLEESGCSTNAVLDAATVTKEPVCKYEPELAASKVSM